MLIHKFYSASSQEYIDVLKAQTDSSSTADCVVDTLGFTYQQSDGRFVKVDENTSPENRFEIRSLAHVRAYGFSVIHFNKVAQNLLK